jgi:hypothetical protein
MNLERQSGEQTVHLVQGVFAHARPAAHDFTLFNVSDI